MDERLRQKEQYLQLPEEDELSGEHLDNQVQKAQEQLVALKRQQEQIEKQKRELEELSRRQDLLHQGRTEMTEKLTRALVVVEREAYEAQKRVEQLHSIHESFSQHMAIVESINPKAWDGGDINKELNRALSAVDDARAEYMRSRTKITSDAGEEGGGDPMAAQDSYYHDHVPEKDFVYWLKAGFAFTLPLVLIGIVLVVILLSQFAA